MAEPYRSRTGREGCIWLFVILLGIAGQIGLMAALNPYQKQLQAWILPIGAIPFVIAIAIAIWIQTSRTRKRHAAIAKALTNLGCTVITKVDDRLREQLIPHLTSLQQPFGLRNGVEGLVWVAFTPDLLIFEHLVITGSGRSTVENVNTVVAFASTADDPRGARLGAEPNLWLNRMRIGAARSMRKEHGEDIATGDEHFDKAWAIYGNETTANQFLTYDVKTRLMDSPRGETWSLGKAWAACGYAALFDATNMVCFLNHVRSALDETRPNQIDDAR